MRRSGGHLSAPPCAEVKMNRLARIAHRYETLLRVNEIALSKSTIKEVFHGMCTALREQLAYDRAGLTLYDSHHDSLRIEALYGSYENSVFRVGYLLPRNSSQNGWTFEQQTQTIRRDLAAESQFPSEKQTLDDGYRSLCLVPLVVRTNSIGVVTVVGARKNQFSASHAQLVQEMSNQIAMAIVSIIGCPTHPNTKLVCPKCIGAAGGRTTASKHREDLSNWGKKGGRGRKKLDIS